MNYAATAKPENQIAPFAIAPSKPRHWGMEAVWVTENGRLTCKWIPCDR